MQPREAAIEGVRAACAAVMKRDTNQLADAVEKLEPLGFEAVRFLRYLAAIALWDGAGEGFAPEDYRREVVEDLEGEDSPWEGFFDDGVLRSVVDVLSRQPAAGRHVPDDQVLASLLAVACHELPARPDRWSLWEEHFECIADDYRHAEPSET